MTETNNNHIRKIKFQGLEIGGENDFLANKPLFALQLNIFNFDDSHVLIKKFYGEKTPIELIKTAQEETQCDILALKFNVSEEEQDIVKATKLLKELLPHITKPLLIHGINDKAIDTKLLPALANALDRQAIISFAEENTYKEIVPSIIAGNHILSIRTPIDINLAKEMNILTTDMGLNPDNILIDTDMGGLGYGLEYSYSVMERIKLAAFSGDKMLNMPMISFVGEEVLKAKETKSDNYDKSYGELNKRGHMYEIAASSAVIATGCNILVIQHPETVSTIKSIMDN